jgi:hypothetical protein
MRLFLVLVLFGCFVFRITAQNATDTIKHQKTNRDSLCLQEDVGFLFRKKDEAPKPPKKFGALLYPNISANPSNGFMYGVGGTFGWYFGSRANTKVSGAVVTIAYTTKNQLITFIKSNTYTRGNSFFLQGDWRCYIYSQPTFGLGTNAPDTTNIPSSTSWMDANTSEVDGSFPMKFNYLKLHEIVNIRIVKNLYAGLGYQLDYYGQIKDLLLNTDTLPQQITPHYYYSKKYGFDTSAYAQSGICANVIYDSRDNLIDAYKGIYANIRYTYNFTFLGSSQEESALWVEFRTYLGVSKKRPRHLVAFWLFGDFDLSGKSPYLTLPYIGMDQRTRSGRGYVNGRFRGDNILYGECEYRFPISPCTQILGGVVFVNATTTSNLDRNVGLFAYVQPAIGLGLRVMVNKNFRTNLNFDFAIGRQSKGFYLTGQETF